MSSATYQKEFWSVIHLGVWRCRLGGRRFLPCLGFWSDPGQVCAFWYYRIWPVVQFLMGLNKSLCCPWCAGLDLGQWLFPALGISWQDLCTSPWNSRRSKWLEQLGSSHSTARVWWYILRTHQKTLKCSLNRWQYNWHQSLGWKSCFGWKLAELLLCRSGTVMTHPR